MRTGHTACWIPEATNSDSEYVILIAFLLQKYLHQGASVLLYTYGECTVGFCSYFCSQFTTKIVVTGTIHLQQLSHYFAFN